MGGGQVAGTSGQVGTWVRRARASLLPAGRPRTGGAVAGVTTLALAVPLALGAAFGGGYVERLLDLTSGTAWAVSPAQGLVSLVDGASDRVVAGVAVPGAGHDLRVVQNDAGAYLVDADAGTVALLDPALLAVGRPVRLGTPGAGLHVVQNDPDPAGGDGARHVVHVVDPEARTVRRVDPRTLDLLGEATTTAQPGAGQAVAGPHGDLWLVDAAGGTLDVAGSPGAGTHVQVRLPVVADDAADGGAT